MIKNALHEGKIFLIHLFNHIHQYTWQLVAQLMCQ